MRCFFDIDCIDNLANSLSLFNINATDIVLKDFIETRYQPISSLLQILSNLMVEQWNNQTSYNNYFNQCKPSHCTATFIQRGNLLYIITTLIGLIGGFIKVYRFIIPILVKVTIRTIIPFLQKRCKRTNNN